MKKYIRYLGEKQHNNWNKILILLIYLINLKYWNNSK